MAIRSLSGFQHAVPALVLSCLGLAASSAEDIVINEVMSSNGTTLRDETGKYPDWIEILNLEASEVRLLGYGLSDGANPLGLLRKIECNQGADGIG